MTALMTRSKLFDDFFRDLTSPGFLVRPLLGEPMVDPARVRIDIQDRGDAFEVKADLPGVRKEDIQVQVDGNMVTLSAEVRQEDTQGTEGKSVYAERYYGAMTRSFALPADVEASSAKARCEHGVLTLTLPKARSTRTTRLMIE